MPLSRNNLPKIIVVMTISAKYIFLITTYSIHPLIRYLIIIFIVPIISSSLEVVEINVSSLSNSSRVITWSKSLQIWYVALLSQTTLSFRGCRLLEILLTYNKVMTRLLQSFNFCWLTSVLLLSLSTVMVLLGALFAVIMDSPRSFIFRNHYTICLSHLLDLIFCFT